MGTVSPRKRPFSDLSETDLDEYERRIRDLRTMADVLREVERFIKTEPEMTGSSNNAGGSSGSASPGS